MFDDIKSLIANVQAVQIGDALIDLGSLSTKLGNTYNALLRGEKFAVDDTQLDSSISDLETCCDNLAKQPKSAPDEKAMDPATILLIVKTALEALKMFREWRKKRQES